MSKKLSPLSKSSSKNTPKRSVTPEHFLRRVQNFAALHQLFVADAHFIIAVSGGPDSMALLTCLTKLQKKYHWTLTVAHVNYQLRGKDSALDEALVRKHAEYLNLPCYVKTVAVAPHSSEEQLRVIRYSFFETLAKKLSADAVALAHHQNDQAETLLLRIIRGTGGFGLQGMRPKRDQYLRPLLAVTRSDILTFLKSTKTPFRKDKSNDDPHFLRNRVRNELLPLLAKHYNPRIQEALSSLAETTALEQALLFEFGHKLIKTARVPRGLTFSRTDFLALSQTKQFLCLRLWCQTETFSPPTKNRLQELHKILNTKKQKRYTLSFRGLKLEAKDDTMTLLFE